VFAMWSRRGGRASAYAAMLVGAIVYAGGEHLELLAHPYLTALAAALLAYVAAGLLPSRANRATLR
jgi:hypothetical protein